MEIFIAFLLGLGLAAPAAPAPARLPLGPMRSLLSLLPN